MAAEIQINCGAAKVAALPFAGKWSQRMVDTVWQAMGYPAPAPLLPKSMEGWYEFPTRGPAMLTLSPSGSLRKSSARGVTAEEAKFRNFWGQAVTDPCRKQSGISKIAGGILQVASVFVPQMAYFQAAQTAVNTVQDVKRQQELVKSGTDLLTQAAQAQIAAANNPAPITTTPAAPTLAPALVAPAAFAPAAPKARAPARRTFTTRDYAILAGVGVGLYLLLRRIRTR